RLPGRAAGDQAADHPGTGGDALPAGRRGRRGGPARGACAGQAGRPRTGHGRPARVRHGRADPQLPGGDPPAPAAAAGTARWPGLPRVPCRGEPGTRRHPRDADLGGVPGGAAARGALSSSCGKGPLRTPSSDTIGLMVGATRSGRARPGAAVLLLAVALYLLIVLVRHFVGGVGWADSFLWMGFVGLAVFAAVVYAVLWFLFWRRR